MSKKNKDLKSKTKNSFDCKCNENELNNEMSCDCHKDNCHCTKKNAANDFEKGE